MLIIILLLALTIIFFLLAFLDNKFWELDFIEYISLPLGIVASLLLLIAFFAIILSFISAPENQALYETKYFNLSQKIEHIDSYNRGEIECAVTEWNTEYRKNTYGAQSLWTNWFYSLDTSKVDLIELKGD